jgi:signal transduction histidine kinase
MAGPFLSHSAEEAVIYQKAFQKKTLLLDVSTGRTSFGDSVSSDTVASVLDADSYVSVPVTYRNEPIGRLFIIGGQRKFDVSDIDFVVQLIDHLMPVLENIRLIDNLASDAAEQERRRIARDIHDSIIQPYVGLQFGLAALRQKLEAGIDVIADVKELLDLTSQELDDLRGYVRDLRAGELRHDVLLPALKRFTEKFSGVTGINVEVEAHCEAHITDRLAGELFQIVTEGLSNIRRHSRSREARVELTCQGGVILLRIKNRTTNTNGDIPFGSDGDGDGIASFTPRSIAERAELLGGHTEVFLDENNYTVVSVGIPL